MTLRKEIASGLQKLFEEKKKEILKKKSEDKPRVEDADRDDETHEEDDDKKKSIVKKDKGAYSKLSTDGDRVVSEALSTSLKREIDAMKRKGMDAVEIAMHMDKKHGNSLKKKDHDNIAEYLSEDTLEEVFNVDMIEESLGPNFHVLAKKGDYTFARDKKKGISVVFYKGKEIDSGDFDQGADGWFLNHKSFRSQSNAFFDKAQDVVDHFFKNRITG